VIALALLIAVAISALAATALGLWHGVLDASVAWLSLVAGALGGVWSWWKTPHAHVRREPPGPWEWGAIVVYALASARAFLWLVFTDGDKIKVLSPNNLGDLALHLTYIRHLASGAAFWPDNPILTHSQLSYPIGVDLFNALLTLAGVDPLRGLIWVGLGGAALTGVALWRWGRGIALLALLANGGLAALAILATRELADFQATLAWKNLFLALIVTQRGLLYALPAGLFLLVSWRARYLDGAEGDRLPRWAELLLYASLPLFHLHTFIFLSLLLASWFVLLPERRRDLGAFIAAAFLPATALVLLVTGGAHGAGVIGIKLGWMWDEDDWVKWCGEHLRGPARLSAGLLFWPVNFGFALPLVAWLGWRLWNDPASIRARAVFFPALFIFLLCVVVKFAPWEWDNTKIMIWSWLAIIPLAWEQLIAARPLAQRVLTGFALFGSGLASLAGGLDGSHIGYDLATRGTLDAVEKAVEPLPIRARFASYPTYNHPLLLTGRSVALGYPGHTWSHGLQWEGVAAHVDALMNGAPDWRAAAVELGVRYLFWGDEEREHYGDSPQPWKERATLVAQGDWGELYDLRPALR
jgi:hypothetical protein